MRWWTVFALTLVSATLTAVGTEPGQLALDEQLNLQAGGNELTVSSIAPVLYGTLEELMAALARPPSRGLGAIRLVRASPPEAIDYVLCVTPEGTLVLAEQVFDMARGRPSFVRAGIARAYEPLPRPGPWVWLAEIPVSREVDAVLELQATSASWPVRSVKVKLSRTP